MNRRASLGEFEHLVLLAVLSLGEDAHSRTIRDDLETRAGRVVSRSTAYITLERLTDKGYLEASMGASGSGRDGHRARRYAVTVEGREALRESGRALMRMWEGQEALLGEP